MEKYFIIFLILVTSSLDQAQATCESDVNLCTADFTQAQQEQARSGFNLTAICSIVNDFMTCVNRGLEPCDVITKNTLMSAIDQLIEIYTDPPYGCELTFADTFEYGNCSQQVTKCAFFKYDAEDLKDNATEACEEFNKFVDCMETNTTACKGDEQVEITQSIQNTTSTFSKCPYACDQPDLVCTTVSSTTPALVTQTVFVSASPTLPSVSVSDLDLSEYYMVTLGPSDDFYNPSEIVSLYSDDVTDFYSAGISEDLLDQTALFESDDLMSETYATYSIQPTSTSSIQATQTQSVYTSSTTPVTSPASTPSTTQTKNTSSTPTPSTTKSTQKTTTPAPTKTTSKAAQQTSVATTKKDTATSTTATPTTTTSESKNTVKVSTEEQSTKTSSTTKETPKTPRTTKTAAKTSSATDKATPKTTTDFPTPNYDNAGVMNRQSAIIILTSLIFAFMS